MRKTLFLNKQTPSISFRFPDLISDRELIKKLLDYYSLIPLGAYNWLVKRERDISNDDIILVYGNLNEHISIELFFNSFNKNLSLKSIESALK